MGLPHGVFALNRRSRCPNNNNRIHKNMHVFSVIIIVCILNHNISPLVASDFNTSSYQYLNNFKYAWIESGKDPFKKK